MPLDPPLCNNLHVLIPGNCSDEAQQGWNSCCAVKLLDHWIWTSIQRSIVLLFYHALLPVACNNSLGKNLAICLSFRQVFNYCIVNVLKCKAKFCSDRSKVTISIAVLLSKGEVPLHVMLIISVPEGHTHWKLPGVFSHSCGCGQSVLRSSAASRHSLLSEWSNSAVYSL